MDYKYRRKWTVSVDPHQVVPGRLVHYMIVYCIHSVISASLSLELNYSQKDSLTQY